MFQDGENVGLGLVCMQNADTNRPTELYMNHIHIHEQIGSRLREARRRAKMTLRETALVLNVSVGHLSEVERGHTEATVGLLLNACELLGVSSDQILYGRPQWASCPPAGRLECQIVHFYPKAPGAPQS